MRKTLICLLLAFFFATDLFAQGGTRPSGGKQNPQTGSNQNNELNFYKSYPFESLDLNQDGNWVLEEASKLTATPKSIYEFFKLDKNKNQNLDKLEYAGRQSPSFEIGDKDNNGIINFEEWKIIIFEPNWQSHFLLFDRNNNRVVTKDEFLQGPEELGFMIADYNKDGDVYTTEVMFFYTGKWGRKYPGNDFWLADLNRDNNIDKTENSRYLAGGGKTLVPPTDIELLFIKLDRDENQMLTKGEISGSNLLTVSQKEKILGLLNINNFVGHDTFIKKYN